MLLLRLSVYTIIFINYNSFYFDNNQQVTRSVFLAVELSVHEELYTNGSPCLLRCMVTLALLPVTSAAAAFVGISHLMALSVALLVELHGAYYMATAAGKNLHRHRHIEGHCNNIHKGKVRVGIWVGNCNNGHVNADAYTGWTTMSRIFIEEVARVKLINLIDHTCAQRRA